MTFSRIAIIISVLVLFGCNTDAPEYGEYDSRVSIAYLKSLCRGSSYEITDDLSISGTVVANDHLGEFYKSIVIVDDTGGIEIAIDRTDIYLDVPIHSRITVFCSGLSLGLMGGKIELGAHPTGEFPVDGIAANKFASCFKTEANGENTRPRECNISELTSSDISSYVVLRDVRLTKSDTEAWCQFVDGEYIDTYHTLEDRGGATLPLRVRATCAYAGAATPDGQFAVAGIIDYSGDTYYLRIANYGISEKR